MKKNPFFGKWSQDDSISSKSSGWYGPMVSEQEEAVILAEEEKEPKEYKTIRSAARILALERRLTIESLSGYLEDKYPELIETVCIKTLRKIISEF